MGFHVRLGECKGPECVRGLGTFCLQLLSALWYPSDTHASPILPETDIETKQGSCKDYSPFKGGLYGFGC